MAYDDLLGRVWATLNYYIEAMQLYHTKSRSTVLPQYKTLDFPYILLPYLFGWNFAIISINMVL